jgi:hypothetical protein
MENYKIYALKLIDDDNIKYIGFTSRNLEDRFKEHLYVTINLKYKNGYWIKKYKDNIEIILIEDNIKSIEEVCEREIFYIRYYRELGFNLNNLTNGGGGMRATDETRRKISESQKGKTLSNEHKEKIRNTLTGRKLTPEHIENVKNSKIGYKCSDETKLRMSESKKGIIFSDEHKNNISKSKKGKPAPNKGITCSDKQKRYISDILKGKPTSKSRIIDVFIYKTGEYVGRFDSISECFTKLNLKSNHINSVLNGDRKQSYGYTFKEVLNF